jgi:hypothetical protein
VVAPLPRNGWSSALGVVRELRADVKAGVPRISPANLLVAIMLGRSRQTPWLLEFDVVDM